MEGLGLVVVEIGNALVIDLPYHLSVCFQSWDHSISADFMQFKINHYRLEVGSMVRRLEAGLFKLKLIRA